MAHAALKEGLTAAPAPSPAAAPGGNARDVKRSGPHRLDRGLSQTPALVALPTVGAARAQVGLGRKESDIMLTASSKQGRMFRGNSIQRLPITRDRSDRKLRR